MAPLPNTSSTMESSTISSIFKRDSDCTYYDASCSAHRTIILAIMIVVGLIAAFILALVFFRGRKRRTTRQQEITAATIRAREARAYREMATAQSKLGTDFSGVPQEAPPPYMPRQPENVARVGR